MSRLESGVASVLGKGMFSVDETFTTCGCAGHKRRASSEAQHIAFKAMAYIIPSTRNPSREVTSPRMGLE